MGWFTNVFNTITSDKADEIITDVAEFGFGFAGAVTGFTAGLAVGGPAGAIGGAIAGGEVGAIEGRALGHAVEAGLEELSLAAPILDQGVVLVSEAIDKLHQGHDLITDQGSNTHSGRRSGDAPKDHNTTVDNDIAAYDDTRHELDEDRDNKRRDAEAAYNEFLKTHTAAGDLRDTVVGAVDKAKGGVSTLKRVISEGVLNDRKRQRADSSAAAFHHAYIPGLSGNSSYTGHDRNQHGGVITREPIPFATLAAGIDLSGGGSGVTLSGNTQQAQQPAIQNQRLEASVAAS